MGYCRARLLFNVAHSQWLKSEELKDAGPEVIRICVSVPQEKGYSAGEVALNVKLSNFPAMLKIIFTPQANRPSHVKQPCHVEKYTALANKYLTCVNISCMLTPFPKNLVNSTRQC